MFDIKNLFLFADLNEEKRTEAISMLGNPVKFLKRESILCPYNKRLSLGIIVYGTAAAFSGKLIKRSFAQGDVFGAASIFSESEPYISDIRAISDALVVFLDESLLKRLFEAYPETALRYISFLSSKVVFLNRKIDQLSAGGTSGKLYQFLTDNSDSENSVSVEGMASLARLVGMGRTSLYRALNELEQSGMIIRNNNTIRVVIK